MDYFDKKFKEDFSSKEELPDGFSWEEMKPEIYEKMDRRKGIGMIRWISLGLLGLCLIAGLYVYSTTPELDAPEKMNYAKDRSSQASEALVNEESHSSSSLLEKELKKKDHEKSSIVSKENNQDIINSSKLKTSDNKPADRISNLSSLATSKAITSTAPNANQIRNEANLSNPKPDIGTVNAPMIIGQSNKIPVFSQSAVGTEVDPQKKYSSATSGPRQKDRSSMASESLDVRSISSSDFFATQSSSSSNPVGDKTTTEKGLFRIPRTLISIKPKNLFQTIRFEDFRFSFFETEVFEKLKLSKKTSTSIPFEISLATGYNLWNLSKRDPNTKGFLSFEVSPEISIKLKNNVNLNLGYQYSNLVEEFKYNAISTSRVELPNELISTTVNSFTGNFVSEERRDTFVNATTTRELLQYNQYKMHSLQIGADYKFELSDRWSLCAGLGARYVFNLSGNGYRIYIAPNDAADPRGDREPFSGNKLGLNSSVRLNYSLGRIFAFVKAQGTKYLSNWEQNTYHPVHRPFIYGVQLGMGYDFGK